jgi:malate synthase
MSTSQQARKEVEVLSPIASGHEHILTPEALEFLKLLHREFNPRRLELLKARTERQKALDAGTLPDFLPETKAVREGEWRVDPVPEDMQDRRVEITGPVDRKMIVNALNSGARTFMADFEDSHSPTWHGTLDGQANLFDAERGQIDFTAPGGKRYALKEKTATLIVRPRGWHLNERHVTVDGEPVSGSLFDFALYFFHNARRRLEKGSGTYLYLPKLEHHLEARLWNDVFTRAEGLMGVPEGTVKATVLIETILASFQMEEILFELRRHSAGLNCGRWDYMFSYIKKLGGNPRYLLPDRGLVTMTVPFMRAYTLSCIRACHKRGAHAMGGMAAQIPIKNDEKANAAALEKVRCDKEREARDGHDGTWVAHPGLVPIAMAEFDKVLGDRPNQLDKMPDAPFVAADFIEPPQGAITEAGLRQNISVGIQYIASWLCGNGCVPLYNLMEDAATAEISRTQVWQWAHHPEARLADGRKVTLELVRAVTGEEMDKLARELGPERFADGRLSEARVLFDRLVAAEKPAEFLTLEAYALLD